MSANSFGQHFKIHSFGESHGAALGVVIDGMPSGVPLDLNLLNECLERRRPGNWNPNHLTSSRKESDSPEILSGFFEGVSLGTPIAVIIKNENQKSEDYNAIKTSPRAGHADDVWKQKFGHSDHRGGGRSSGRETVARVIGGAFAEMAIREISKKGGASVPLKVLAYSSQIGPYRLDDAKLYKNLKSMSEVEQFSLRFPHSRHQEIKQELANIQQQGESWGGAVDLKISGVPSGIGQPVFHKLKSDLASAMLSIGATCGLQVGVSDMDLAEFVSQPGSQFHGSGENKYGGIRGGISTGEEISMRVFFKPTSSILDVAKKGRHDPCIVPRAVSVVQAMGVLVMIDHLLWQRLDRI